MPLSDMYGRAFEFAVTKSIHSKLEEFFPGRIGITVAARKAQLHGQEQFVNLPRKQKTLFGRSGVKIAKWLADNKFKAIQKMKFEKPSETLVSFSQEESVSGIVKIELDRIPDIAGVRGDVTDIRIKFFSKYGVATLNVSIKHRHEALKHPRLTRVPAWIGLDNTKEEKEYLAAYERIWSTFFQKGRELSLGAKRFRELKALDPAFIVRNLYDPLYTLVTRFLQENTANPLQVQKMFGFMVGKFDYVKFIDHDGRIEVRDFSDIPKPNSVEIEYGGDGYLYLQFDNGLRISGRLHTATQWLKKSIKFDMQPVNLDSIVPAVHIDIFSQSLT